MLLNTDTGKTASLAVMQLCQQYWPYLHDPCGQQVTLPSPCCHHFLCFLNAGAQLDRKGPRCGSNEAPHVTAADCTIADQAILRQQAGGGRNRDQAYVGHVVGHAQLQMGTLLVQTKVFEPSAALACPQMEAPTWRSCCKCRARGPS